MLSSFIITTGVKTKMKTYTTSYNDDIVGDHLNHTLDGGRKAEEERKKQKARLLKLKKLLEKKDNGI